MAVQTDDKKLDGVGLGVVWGCVKSLYNLACVGVQSVEQIQTSDVSGGTNVIRVTLTNGNTSDFEVKNGQPPTMYVKNETLYIK